jgi:GNAT superfamily N-acetyltransferase
MVEQEASVSVRSIQLSDYEPVLRLAGTLVTRQEISAFGGEDPSSLCFVAEAEGHVVGFNLAHILYVGIPLTKICIIQGIVVDHQYRRLGIGEKLVEAVEKFCRERGVSTVRTLVEDSDDRLRQFVGNVGFQRSIVDNYDKFL